MLRKADLHQYSTWSRGASDPRAIVDRAMRDGVEAIAITDLATDAAYIEASTYGMQNRIEVLRATALPVRFSGGLFTIIAYGANARNAAWRNLVRSEHSNHHVRAAAIATQARGLQSADVPWSQLSQILTVIHGAGGVASLAYPGVYGFRAGSIFPILESMQHIGLDAIEAYSPLHHPAFIDDLVQFANARGLLITGGSAHGLIDNRSSRNRGTIYLPLHFYVALKKRLDKNHGQ